MQLRAGESFADAEGVGNSNPVNKQSRYAELTSLGKRQIVQRVAPALAENVDLDGAWIWPSINSCSYQTAAILSATLALGAEPDRARVLVPRLPRPRCAG